MSAVQFAHDDAPSEGSAALRAETRRLAAEALRGRRPEDAVPLAGLRRLLLLLLLPASILTALALYDRPLVATGLVRLFVPWSSLEYPTRTRIEILNADRVLREGDALRLEARLSGQVPSHARIVLRTGSGEPRERSLEVVDAACAYEAETVFRSFEYRIRAGDAASAWHAVRVIGSPRIDRAQVRLDYPAYTQRPSESVEALTLSVPEGTELHWTLTLDRPVSAAQFLPVEAAAVPMEVGADGRTLRLRQRASESRAYGFGWTDAEYGFRFQSPRHYLQVAPDRAPSAELSSPDGLQYATLARAIDFGFRARDDHGIAEVALVWRVGKTAEERFALPAPERADGREQRVDWDHRTALPTLAVGDTVSFAIELSDSYPGPNGPHRARSDALRVRFLAPEDYLAQIEKERRRLLERLRAVYREERGVHELLRELEPSAAQLRSTCQLEAVRQDLLRERLEGIRGRLGALRTDVEANGLSTEDENGALVQLMDSLERIGSEHIGRAANQLRSLAAEESSEGVRRGLASAVQAVNGSARELGLVVLTLGFAEASEVMARELHATAQTQAGLRSLVLQGAQEEEREELERRQSQLADESERLLAATPTNQESTQRDALLAFQLARMANELLRAGTDAKMRRAATLVAAGELAQAAPLQAEVIASLLRAEFRLRVGAEVEALQVARAVLEAQLAGQSALREEAAGMSESEFRAALPDLAQRQADLQRSLQHLLLPECPAPRARLLDQALPPRPAVDHTLAQAADALEQALAQLESGQRALLAEHQRSAEAAFEALRDIVVARLSTLRQEERMRGAVAALGKHAAQRLMLEERLLVLLEQLEDALDEEAASAPLAALNRALALDARALEGRVGLWSDSLADADGGENPGLEGFARAASALEEATPLLANNEAEAALEPLETALEILEELGAHLDERARSVGALATMLATTARALRPSPLLAEIVDEQQALSAVAEEAEPEERLRLVIPQRNLIHAVDAVLDSLDALAHSIPSGTVMLFAKDDMDAAAIGLETDDLEEALDAQAYVAESLQELRAKIDTLTPQYGYALEIVEALHGLSLRNEALVARAQALQARDAAALRPLAEAYAREARQLTGQPRFEASAQRLAAGLASSESAQERAAAVRELVEDAAQLRTLSENLAFLMTPPPLTGSLQEPTPEVVLLQDALSIAAQLQQRARQAGGPNPPSADELDSAQRALLERARALLARTDPPHPSLLSAVEQLALSVSALDSQADEQAIAHQFAAEGALRAFVLEYALEHVRVPPPPPPQDAAPSDAVPEDGALQLFLPGALTGTRPRGGRLEWQVLGRRERAALNENFARELPLEYRAILKDYYERLAQ